MIYLEYIDRSDIELKTLLTKKHFDYKVSPNIRRPRLYYSSLSDKMKFVSLQQSSSYRQIVLQIYKSEIDYCINIFKKL